LEQTHRFHRIRRKPASMAAPGNMFRLHARTRSTIQTACQPSGHPKTLPQNLAQRLGGRPTEVRRAPLVSRQPACKPGSGWHAGRARIRDGHSSGTPVARRLKRPTRTARSGHRSRSFHACAQKPRAVPIRSCSRWGLPCRRRCRRRGALLPHRFTLTAAIRNTPRRSVLCGTVPGFAPAGCYPAPFVHGARTFLPGNLSVSPERPSGRLTGTGMGALARAVKSESLTS
jgi:hypothetical protein